MQIRRGIQAEEDLIEIWLYVARRNVGAADRLLDRLEERWKLLATQPRSGVDRSDLIDGVRFIATGEYLTFYRIDDTGIEILRVLHGRRNISADDFPR